MPQGNMDILSWVMREPQEAADEIERLRADNERLRAVIRDALDLLSDGPGGPRRISAMKVLTAALDNEPSAAELTKNQT